MPEHPAQARPPIHCVLWHAPEAPPSAELASLLVQRGVTLETCSNPYAAAARVCRVERAARARRRPGEAVDGVPAPAADTAPDTAPLVLLLCEPARLPMRDALARVLELHAPRTVCWVYQQSSGATLRSVALGQIHAEDSPGPRPTDAPSGASPGAGPGADRGAEPPIVTTVRGPGRLTLVPAGAPRPEPAEPHRPQVPINSGSVLTDEELSMLLSDGGDPAPRRGRTTSQEPPRSHRP